jgi:probable rRNA maturation factor
MVSVEISGKLPAGVDDTFVRKLIGAAWRAAGGTGRAQLSVRVVSDAAIRQLNRRYRMKDRTTDVLSFRYEEAKDFPEPPSKVKELGDIVISLPQVRRQAKEIGRSPAAELALMVVHGTLHLMGHDHETVAQENQMFGLQHDVLARLGVI